MSNKTFITIEWLAETMDDYGDIYDIYHADTYAEAKRWAEGHTCRVDIGLVRDRGNDADGVIDRQWAYIEDGKLPARFSACGGPDGPKVPARYHKEIAA